MKKWLLGLGCMFFLLAASKGYAFSTTCPNGEPPLAVLTLHYDWDRNFTFRSTCFIACADHTFYTDENESGLWEVWEGAGSLKYTNTIGGACKAFYVFSMITGHGFMMCTDGQMQDGRPGYAFFTPGCNQQRFSSETTASGGAF